MASLILLILLNLLSFAILRYHLDSPPSQP